MYHKPMDEKYDKIGANYNLTRKADKYLTERLLRNLNPSKSGIYLDVGCGTGNYTHELQQKGYKFIGIDPSETMLAKAELKNTYINWVKGTAENTSLETASVDGIISSLTIHHWDDLNLGFQELYRVLKPTGTIVIFTSTPKQMRGYWLNHYFPKMMESSITQMPSYRSVERVMFQAGFRIAKTENYDIKTNLKDLFLYSGKHNPSLYFDEKIRKGISSFSALANAEEVADGLEKLRSDIDKGSIHSIMESYQNDGGDYMYIVGKKPK